MNINELYLNDIEMFDNFARNFKNVEEFKHNLKFILKTKHIYYSGTDNLQDMKKANKLLLLDNEGCIHALLLNLFLKGGKSSIKEYIKEKINLSGIESIDKDFKDEISGKLSIDRALLDDLISMYYESLDKEIGIVVEEYKYISQVNQYYKDECERIQLISNELESELRKVGI